MGKQSEAREDWKQRVAGQEQSGLSVRAYCKQQGLGEHSFYQWRKRLRTEAPVSFALVEERKAARAEREPRMLELALNGGECLRIPCEEAALELVLRVVRALR
jgi:transposase-like protein